MGSAAPTLETIPVFADPAAYAAFPGLIRTRREVVLRFKVQPLDALRASPVHPHCAPVAREHYAVSTDGGRPWRVGDQPPALAEPLQVTRGDYYAGIALDNGDILTVGGEHAYGYHSRLAPRVVQVWRGAIDRDPVFEHELTEADVGGSTRLHPFSLARLADGSLLLGGQADHPGSWFEESDTSCGRHRPTTVLFLRGSADGRRWAHHSHIDSQEP